MQPSAKQQRPEEQVFFADPAIDALMGVVMALATEHYVLRDRVRALEEQLARSGHVDSAALGAAPSASARAGQQQDAAAFVRDLLDPILGLQAASGAEGRFSLKESAKGATGGARK